MTIKLEHIQSSLADRYRVERQLGRGGMGSVFMAEDLRHHRRVAIKVLDPELARAIGPDRFLREIQTLAALNHPHIVPFHDSGEAGRLPFYVMALVEGESLRQRLDRERQLPLDDALRIAREVADALEYAHGHGVVHRDIKPENILLGERHAVVSDFGIARAIHAAGGARVSDSGIAIGTPFYMSPEQAAGDAVDGRCDLYALGCVLYEMLAGQSPFTGPTAESVTYQHLNAPPPRVTQIRPTVPDAMERAVMRAMAKSPADRFQTGAEFAAALNVEALNAAGATPARAPAGGAPSAGQEPPPPEALGLPGRRGGHRALRLSLAGVAVLALAGWLAARNGWLPIPGGARDTTATHSVKKSWILVADFDGPPEDPGLARAAREIVVDGLNQSPAVTALPHEQIQLALQLAGKPDTLRMTPELARELAYRSTVRATLEGSISRIGSRYSVTLRLADVEANRELLALTDLARSADALIPMLTRMAKRIRERLGRARRCRAPCARTSSGRRPRLPSRPTASLRRGHGSTTRRTSLARSAFLAARWSSTPTLPPCGAWSRSATRSWTNPIPRPSRSRRRWVGRNGSRRRSGSSCRGTSPRAGATRERR